MVLMARGVSVKWKQIIGTHLTDNKGVVGKTLWEFVKEGITSLENVGYRVTGITSDMGSSNLSMWKHLGITAVKHSIPNTYIPHPVREDENLYIFADVPHLLKNLKALFLKQDIILAQSTVQKYGLPSNTVSINHIKSYLDISPNTTFSLAPHLVQLKHLLL